ncbi:MAG: hypothetical protein FWC51_03355, partial [Proteobacteria bacterium]|nr:hypothetical protein [Pseudomonadota bacterium]
MNNQINTRIYRKNMGIKYKQNRIVILAKARIPCSKREHSEHKFVFAACAAHNFNTRDPRLREDDVPLLTKFPLHFANPGGIFGKGFIGEKFPSCGGVPRSGGVVFSIASWSRNTKKQRILHVFFF